VKHNATFTVYSFVFVLVSLVRELIMAMDDTDGDGRRDLILCLKSMKMMSFYCNAQVNVSK
jgi:hypothetical protein